MADLDAEVRDLAQQISRDILREYQAKRKTMTGAERQTMLAELSAFNRTVEASAVGAAYPFFSPSAIASGARDGELARLQAESAP